MCYNYIVAISAYERSVVQYFRVALSGHTLFRFKEVTMKLLIIGSRTIDNIDISPYIPQDVSLIISGGASGVDTLAERYADKYKISKLIMYPQYDLYKRGAPLKRNEKMIEVADEVLAFWDGKSKGTKYSIDFATKQGKSINIVNI